MPDSPIPDPRGEDRDQARALAALKARPEGRTHPGAAREDYEASLLEAQIKVNREQRRLSGEHPGAYHRSPGQYLAALIGAAFCVGATVYLVAGVLATLAYGALIVLQTLLPS